MFQAEPQNLCENDQSYFSQNIAFSRRVNSSYERNGRYASWKDGVLINRISAINDQVPLDYTYTLKWMKRCLELLYKY